MIPKIKTLLPKKLVGKSTEMSLANNKTFELFSGFMPRRKHIQNTIGNDIYEVLVYDDSYFKNFNPTNSFTKWATIEVSAFKNIPEGMESYSLEGGLYAVFNYKGLPKDFPVFMGNIFTEWLPNSGYILDQREHFQVLGDTYKHNDPNSEEEVWVPIKNRLP